jgi:hypothetical protein
MLEWFGHRRTWALATIVDAEILLRYFGDDAHDEACRRTLNAIRARAHRSNINHWRRVEKAVKRMSHG